jgi:methyl-accepting chemotaxis protein
MALLVCAFIAVMIAYAVFSYDTRQQLQINGPYFDRISHTNELLTNIEPAPLSLADSFLVAEQMATAKDADQRRSLVQKLSTERQSYDAAFEKSARLLAESQNAPLKDAYLVQAHEPAVRFFSQIESEFVPAVLAGDRAKAAALLAGPLQKLYAENVMGIDKAIPLALTQRVEMKNEAESLIKARGDVQIALVLASLALFALVLGPLIGRSVIRPLTATLNALAVTSAQLASTIEEHERTALSQAAAVSQTTSAMDELEASFIQTAEVVRSAAEGVQRSSSIAKEGIKTVRQMQEGMIDLKEKVGTTVSGQILSLSEQTAQISTITNQVVDLANQTNMLALNAAVEAARAGEHGRGFAVVATEIRKLADASRKSADRINVLVDDIQKSTNATVMATEESTKTVDKSILRAAATVAAFNELKEASDSAAVSAQQTLLTVPQQLNAVKQVLESMEALNVGARETTDAIAQTRSGSETLREAVAQLKATI